MSSSSGSYGVGNYPAQNGEGFNQATGNYELGGDLIRPTAINTSATNTLALTGLEAGDSINDSILVVDTSGVVKFVDSSGLPDFWRQVTTGALPDGNSDTTKSVRRVGSVGIGGAADTDAMPTVTTPVATNSYLHLSNNVAHRAQVMYGSDPLIYYMERTVPTVVNNYVTIGSFTMGSQASSFALSVNVSNGGFATAKYYIGALAYHATSNAWRVLTPVSDGGAYTGNNFEVLVNVNTATLTLRIRRTAGATAGTARIYLQCYGDPTTVLTESTATGTDAATYAALDTTGKDFWRSNTGASLPDGSNDVTEFASRTGAVGIGSNTQVGTSQLSVVSDSNTVTDPIISAQANNLTQGVDIIWGGIKKSGTLANSNISINAAGTGNVILHGSPNGETASTGRVGIGIAAPTAKLHVNGANANGSAVPLFRITDTNVAGSYFAVDNGAAGITYRIIATTNLELQSSGNANQVVLSTNGSVGIGTAAPTAGVGNLSVNGNGFKPGGGAWGAFSDVRVKKNIKPVTRGLRELLALHPVSFEYNGKAGTAKDGRTYYSLIAQDVQKVLPEFVEEHQISDEVMQKMGKKDREIFSDQTVLTLKEGMTNFEALLINAVKELADQNAQLAKRIDDLEEQLAKRIDDLEERLAAA